MIESLYTQRESPIQELNLWTKVFCLLLVTPLVAFLSSPMLLAVLFTYVFSLLLWSRLNLLSLCKQGWVFFVGMVLSVLILSVIFGHGNLSGRVQVGTLLGIRFSVVVLSGIFFSRITDPMEMPIGLMSIKLPHRFGVTLMVAVRMVPLIVRKLTIVTEAQRCRGMSIGFLHLHRFPRQIISLAIPAVISTLEASVALSDTLIARGYNPYGRITYPPQRIGIIDGMVAGASAVILIVCVLST